MSSLFQQETYQLEQEATMLNFYWAVRAPVLRASLLLNAIDENMGSSGKNLLTSYHHLLCMGGQADDSARTLGPP